MKRNFLCLECGHRGAENTFGDHVLCPKCSSRNVVDADLWSQYRKKTSSAAQTKSGEPMAGIQ